MHEGGLSARNAKNALIRGVPLLREPRCRHPGYQTKLAHAEAWSC